MLKSRVLIALAVFSLLCLLSFGASADEAATPADATAAAVTDLTDTSSSPESDLDFSTDEAQKSLLSRPTAIKAFCSATAYCADGSTVSCSYTSGSVSCSNVNSDCDSAQQGYAKCGSTYYYCPYCAYGCEENSYCSGRLGCGEYGLCLNHTCRCS